MWFVLRILTLVVVYVWKFFWRRQSVDLTQEFRHIVSAQKIETRKGNFVRAFHGLDYRGPLRFQFTQEGGWDGFFKSLGLAVEQQTGDDGFDRDVYITCDQPALGAALRANPAAVAAVRQLFATGVRRVFADGDFVWAETREKAHSSSDILEQLFTLRAALLTVDENRLESRLDAFFWKAVAVESLAWSLACYGIPGFYELIWHRNTLYVDAGPVFTRGLFYSLAVFAALFGLIMLLLRGSSRGHRIIVESFLLLVIGVPLSTVQALSDANIKLDRSPPTISTYEVTGKYIRKVSRSKGGTSTYYHLLLRPYPNGPLADKTDIKVEYEVYQAVPERKGAVNILSHPGWAGFTWIEDIRPK